MDSMLEGNYYNKYKSNNFIVKYIMNNFHSSLDNFISSFNPKIIYEIGCGEGYLAIRYADKGYKVFGCDISKKCIDIANKSVSNSRGNFIVANIYDSSKLDIKKADLVICCEVLEHLTNPEKALSELQKLPVDNFIFSVPREPLWRLLNLIRGSYIAELGNTPGHLQHWSKRKFIDTINKYFSVKEIASPLPWTIIKATKF